MRAHRFSTVLSAALHPAHTFSQIATHTHHLLETGTAFNIRDAGNRLLYRLQFDFGFLQAGRLRYVPQASRLPCPESKLKAVLQAPGQPKINREWTRINSNCEGFIRCSLLSFIWDFRRLAFIGGFEVYGIRNRRSK